MTETEPDEYEFHLQLVELIAPDQMMMDFLALTNEHWPIMEFKHYTDISFEKFWRDLDENYE
jgi:hypothetical protein